MRQELYRIVFSSTRPCLPQRSILDLSARLPLSLQPVAEHEDFLHKFPPSHWAGRCFEACRCVWLLERCAAKAWAHIAVVADQTGSVTFPYLRGVENGSSGEWQQTRRQASRSEVRGGRSAGEMRPPSTVVESPAMPLIGDPFQVGDASLGKRLLVIGRDEDYREVWELEMKSVNATEIEPGLWTTAHPIPRDILECLTSVRLEIIPLAEPSPGLQSLDMLRGFAPESWAIHHERLVRRDQQQPSSGKEVRAGVSEVLGGRADNHGAKVIVTVVEGETGYTYVSPSPSPFPTMHLHSSSVLSASSQSQADSCVYAPLEQELFARVSAFACPRKQ